MIPSGYRISRSGVGRRNPEGTDAFQTGIANQISSTLIILLRIL